jgi:hypothetical protein
MLTSELVSAIHRDYPDVQVPTILLHLNEVHRFMLTKAIPTRRIIDPSTGKDPQVTFIEGQAVYPIDITNGFPEDSILVERVYSRWDNPLKIGLREGNATESTSVVAYGKTGTYFVRAYKKPVNITGVNIEMEIPERYHHSTVKDAVVAHIEKDEFGRSDLWQEFIQKTVQMFWNEQSIEDTLNQDRTTPYE